MKTATNKKSHNDIFPNVMGTPRSANTKFARIWEIYEGLRREIRKGR